jgi:hypothetical protein
MLWINGGAARCCLADSPCFFLFCFAVRSLQSSRKPASRKAQVTLVGFPGAARTMGSAFKSMQDKLAVESNDFQALQKGATT